MKVTYYNYNFPFTETYQYWDITYHKKSGSEGLVKIVAEIKPSFSELLKFLKERRLVNSDDIATNIWGAYIAQSSNGKRFGEALASFCNTQFNFQLSAWGYSFSNAFAGGDTRCTDKAIKKIKKQLTEQHSTSLTMDCVEYLTNKGLL